MTHPTVQLSSVPAMTCEEARRFLLQHPHTLLLDVRQPSEYAEGHLPGALLMPLPQLSSSLARLHHQQPILVYCRIGNRSRAATHLLLGEGYAGAINLSGGIRAWNGHQAYGDEDQGQACFTRLDNVGEILLTAYGLEEGLQDFYLDLMQQADNDRIIALFRKLADIEDVHKERVFDEYAQLTGDTDRRAFEERSGKGMLEGGMSTVDYLNRYAPDLSFPADVLGLAMGIETQALDLYTRASRQATDPEGRRALCALALEEQRHLEQLGLLLDDLLEGDCPQE